MLINEVHFEHEEEEKPLEPLRLEHFYFPLVCLLGGMVLSAVSFIVEIVIRCCQRNDKL